MRGVTEPERKDVSTPLRTVSTQGQPGNNGQGKEFHSSQRFKVVFELLATALEQERFRTASTAFVTELAVRLDCERVSLGLVHRRRVHLHALSHTAQFAKNNNLVRAIEEAMEEALDQESTVNFPQAGQVTGPEFRITRLHAALFRQYGSGSILSIPLSINGKVAGVLTLERPGDPGFDARVIELCETALNLVGPLLVLRQRDERWLVAKAATSAKQLLGRFLRPGSPAWKLAGISLALFLLFLCFATGDYRISAKTVLEGSIQRAAVAAFDGYVKEAHVRAGDIVRQGDVLCVLDDREFKLELLKWESQHAQLDRHYQQALAELDAAQAKVVSAQMSQAQAQLALINAHLSRTQLSAPFDGVVVTGDLSQSIGAPVERGAVLYEIAPLNSYRVMLEVDERDVAQVSKGQRGQLLLSASPTESMSFTVQNVTPVSVAAEGRNSFRVEATLEAAPDGRLRPGMEGVGKIEICRRRLIWIWTHRAVDWLRLTLWSWLP